MLCIYSNKGYDFKKIGTGVALGNFDGLHVGHMLLINKTIKLCKEFGLESIVYTFNNHPLNVILKGSVVPIITDNIKRKEILGTTKLDYLFLEEFNENFMRMKPEDFMKDILIKKLNAKLVVVGFNYYFGYKGKGDIELLKEMGKEYNINIEVIDPVSIDDKVVSSSLIRDCIMSGEMEQVSKYLNRHFSIFGTVSEGKKLGSKLGFPTANIIPDERNIIRPHIGTYVTSTRLNNKTYKSVTNIGYNPTFNEKRIIIETHIFNVQQELYGQHIEVEFHKMIRNEKKFDSLEELKKQIKRDIIYANKYFSAKEYKLL
jgi:riboflavin kinase/FMN adenylyltransferase